VFKSYIRILPFIGIHFGEKGLKPRTLQKKLLNSVPNWHSFLQRT